MWSVPSWVTVAPAKLGSKMSYNTCLKIKGMLSHSLTSASQLNAALQGLGFKGAWSCGFLIGSSLNALIASSLTSF